VYCIQKKRNFNPLSANVDGLRVFERGENMLQNGMLQWNAFYLSVSLFTLFSIISFSFFS